MYCENEVGSLGSCDGQFWSTQFGACVDEEESDCVNPDLTSIPDETTEESTTEEETTEEATTAEESTDSTTPPPMDGNNPTCPNDRPNEIVFLNSTDCEKYFICFNEVIYAMTCLSGFHWNQAERRCDYPRNANCNVSGLIFFAIFNAFGIIDFL